MIAIAQLVGVIGACYAVVGCWSFVGVLFCAGDKRQEQVKMGTLFSVVGMLFVFVSVLLQRFGVRDV